MVMQENFRVVVLIPAYKPDERLIQLTRKLRDEKLDVLLVDDGGGEQYASIFEQCRALGAEVAVHAVNQGKGRALQDRAERRDAHLEGHGGRGDRRRGRTAYPARYPADY